MLRSYTVILFLECGNWRKKFFFVSEEIFDKSFQISISVDGVLGDHSAVNLVPESEATNR